MTMTSPLGARSRALGEILWLQAKQSKAKQRLPHDPGMADKSEAGEQGLFHARHKDTLHWLVFYILPEVFLGAFQLHKCLNIH